MIREGQIDALLFLAFFVKLIEEKSIEFCFHDDICMIYLVLKNNN